MNTQFSTRLLLSLYPWLDNRLLQNGQAYINNTSQFYYQPDTKLPAGTIAYAAPFKTFVWDSGVSGANILNSVSGSAGVLTRGVSGMSVDFDNGRILVNSAVGTNAVISGSYSFKDFNLYFANQSQESIVFTNKYYLNSRYNRSITGGVPPARDFVTPCMFISTVAFDNEPYAFGGQYMTEATVTINIMAENMGQLEGACSIINDSKDAMFPLLQPNTWPLNPLGDYYSGWNYEAIKAQYARPGNLFCVTDVRVSKVSDYAKIDPAIFLGVAELTVAIPRTLNR